MIRSLWITFVISLAVLFVAIFDKNDRKKFDRMLRFWSKRLLKIIKLKYSIHGLEHVHYQHGKPYVIISNHGSHYDIPLILAALPGSIRMMAKKELFKVPVWGHAMKAAEFISIDRINPRQAVLDLQNAKAKMESGIVPWIAPEGTRTRTGHLNEFKKGAFLLALKSGAMIIPVTIKDSYKILPAKTWDFNIGMHIDMFIDEPIDASQYSSKEIEKLMHHVRQKIQAHVKQ